MLPICRARVAFKSSIVATYPPPTPRNQARNLPRPPVWDKKSASALSLGALAAGVVDGRGGNADSIRRNRVGSDPSLPLSRFTTNPRAVQHVPEGKIDVSFQTTVLAALFVTLFATYVTALILGLLFAWAGSSQATAKPRLQLEANRRLLVALVTRRRASEAVPRDGRVTSREALPDALARWHNRPLLLINYLDREQLHETAFPTGESDVCTQFRVAPQEPWDLYKANPDAYGKPDVPPRR